MSLSEKIAENKAAMNRLYSLTADIVKNKRKFAVLADNTLKVGGMALTALTAFIRGAVDSHVGLTGKAAHNDSAASVGILSKDQWTAVQAPLLPSGICPISRFGSNNYLPTGILGTFESGTTTFNPKTAAMMFEDDGTLVYLRNATNGSVRGVFYAYVAGATSKPNQQPTKTNKRYHPSFFPVGMTAQTVFSCSSTVVFGQLQDADGVAGDYFLALTNGTMDDSKHTGGIVTQATFAAMGGGTGECFVAGDLVIYYGLTNVSSGANPWEVDVSTVPLADVVAANGGELDVTPVTDITTTGFGNVLYSNRSTMRFCDKLMSTVPADKPMVLNSGTFSSVNAMYYGVPALASAVGPDGTIRTKVWSQSRYVVTGAAYKTMTFSWTYNPVTKVAQLDPGFDVQNTATSTTVTADIYSGPVFDGQTLDAMSSPGAQQSQYAFDDSGNVARISNQNTVDGVGISYGKVTGWTNKFNALKCLVAETTIVAAVTNRAQYGSPIGGNLVTPVLVSPTKLLLWSDGVDAAGNWKRGVAYTQLEGSPTYNYSSLYLSDMTGYKPSTVRKYVADDGLTESNYVCLVQEVSSGGIITVSGKRFISGVKLTGASSISPELAVGPTVAISAALMTSLEGMLSSQLTGLGYSVDTIKVDLVIPTATACPPFVMCSFMTTDKKHGITVAQVNLSTDGAGNVIAIASIGVILAPGILYTNTAASIGYSSVNSNNAGACCIYEVADAFLIGASNVWNVNVPGSAALSSVAFKYKKSTGLFVSANVFNNVLFNHYTNTRNFVASPDLGFGYSWSTLAESGISDDATKLVFLPIAKTEAEFDTWVKATVPPIEQRTVLASQEVAQGWIVYFSEPVPVVIGGKYFVMPVQSIDLSLLFTAEGTLKNKTFYIYLKQSGDSCSYAIEAGPSPEGIGTMYLGTITTNDVKITSIVTDKVTRIGTFRLNTEAKGSSIPVSNGLPSSPDTLEWS
jgi:hypothetical protein